MILLVFKNNKLACFTKKTPIWVDRDLEVALPRNITKANTTKEARANLERGVLVAIKTIKFLTGQNESKK